MTLEPVSQRGCEISILADIQNPTGCGPGHALSNWPCFKVEVGLDGPWGLLQPT